MTTIERKVTAANEVPFTVVYDTETRIVTFYDSRHMHTEHGQKVAEYDADNILTVTGGLMLYGGEPDWQVDGTTMATIVDWLSDTDVREQYWRYVEDNIDLDDLPLVTSTERLRVGDRIMIRTDSGNDRGMTVWRIYRDQSIGYANSLTVMAHIRPGGYGVSLRNDNLAKYDVRILDEVTP